MGWYPACKTLSAWNASNNEEYSKCTYEIVADSTSIIRGNINDIRTFAFNLNGATSIQTKFDKILSNSNLDTDPKIRLELAIAHIKNVSSTLTESTSCFEIQGCLERTREVILRLKLVEWGDPGRRASTAGLFFAYHHGMLGPYFGDLEGNAWPHIPLHKDPISLANDFNKLLMDLTFEMSNGILKNISLLDLPAFGSTIGTLRKGLKKQFVWPIKMNFALLKSNHNVNKTSISTSYKTLTEDWATYMNQLGSNDYADYFTAEMKNNRCFNFTRFIKADMKTFLTSIAGNNST